LYERTCQDLYGGNPRLATETGMLGDRTGGISQDPNPNPNPTAEEPSKPLVTKKLPFGLKLNMPKLSTPELMSSDSSPYKVKVMFSSVTIHNDHEGGLSGDGEYDLSLYVHGKLVSLTDMSRTTGGSGLWDVSSGETVRFPPGSEITVYIDKSMPLSIFTVGSEIDGCGRTAFPTDIQGKIVSALERGVNYLIPLGSIQDELDKAINWAGCKLNSNDDIGDIIKSYNPTGYGAGPHADISDKGDFTLRYSLNVIPPTTATSPIIK
jgi:hypothetical protein